MRKRLKQSAYGSKPRRLNISVVLSAKQKKRGTELRKSNVGQKKPGNREKQKREE